MCGRYTMSTPGEVLARQYTLAEAPVVEPHYNIAPTQSVPVVRQSPTTGERRLGLLRWGLIPAWAKDPAIGARAINARSETVGEKPTFRGAFRKRRCLVAADGFYEWSGTPGHKVPYYFALRTGGPFAFAGLWEAWRAPTGDVVETCTILTTEANEVVRPVHPRMPVILPPDAYAVWLDPAVDQPAALVPLLVPFDGSALAGYRVSPRVNAVTNDDAECIQPL